jgi:hypothetical protein
MGIPEGGVGMASAASPLALVRAEVWIGVELFLASRE